MNFYIKLTSAIFLNLKKGGGSSGVSPQITGRSLRCAFQVNYLPSCHSLLVIPWSPPEVRLTSQLQTFSPWEQWVAGSWISYQILLLYFCPIFPFLNVSFHWAWILRLLFRSTPQICHLSENLHRWSIFISFIMSLHWCITDSMKNCSLRSGGMSVLQQTAVFLISHNLHELLKTINALKSNFSFLTCATVICYTLYSEFFWVPIKAVFLSKITIKIGFTVGFFLSWSIPQPFSFFCLPLPCVVFKTIIFA